MPKGIRNGEPREMLDQVVESAHRREVDALMDRVPGNGAKDEMEALKRMRTKLRQALVGGDTRSKRRLVPTAADRDAEREARLKSGKPRRARRARRARRRRNPVSKAETCDTDS